MTEDKKFKFQVYIVYAGKNYKEAKNNLATEMSRMSVEDYKIDTGWELTEK